MERKRRRHARTHARREPQPLRAPRHERIVLTLLAGAAIATALIAASFLPDSTSARASSTLSATVVGERFADRSTALRVSWESVPGATAYRVACAAAAETTPWAAAFPSSAPAPTVFEGTATGTEVLFVDRAVVADTPWSGDDAQVIPRPGMAVPGMTYRCTVTPSGGPDGLDPIVGEGTVPTNLLGSVPTSPGPALHAVGCVQAVRNGQPFVGLALASAPPPTDEALICEVLASDAEFATYLDGVDRVTTMGLVTCTSPLGMTQGVAPPGPALARLDGAQGDATYDCTVAAMYGAATTARIRVSTASEEAPDGVTPIRAPQAVSYLGMDPERVGTVLIGFRPDVAWLDAPAGDRSTATRCSGVTNQGGDAFVASSPTSVVEGEDGQFVASLPAQHNATYSCVISNGVGNAPHDHSGTYLRFTTPTALVLPGAPTTVLISQSGGSAIVQVVPTANSGTVLGGAVECGSGPNPLSLADHAWEATIVFGAAGSYTCTARLRTADGVSPASAPFTITVGDSGMGGVGTGTPVAEKSAIGVLPASGMLGPGVSGEASAAPSAPTNVTAAVGLRAAVVVWDPPVSDGGASISEYRVSAYVASGGGYQPATGMTNPQTLAVGDTFTGLTAGTSYAFRVAAVNASGTGDDSAYSNSVVVAGTPPTPTPPSVVVDTTQSGAVRATFTSIPDFDAGLGYGPGGVSPYAVTCQGMNGGAPGSMTGATSPIVVPGLTPGKRYRCRLTVTNVFGASATSELSSGFVTPIATPGAPTITRVRAGAGEASLVWSAPSGDGGGVIVDYLVTAYELVGGVPVPVAGPVSVGSASATAYTYTSLTACTTYVFRVTAVNSAGNGASSAQSSSVLPYGPADAPQDLFALPGESRIVVGWTAPENNGCAPITSYAVQYRESASTGEWTTLTPGIGTSLKAAIPDLANGTNYDVRVAATNAAGTSTYQPLAARVDGTWEPTSIAPSGSSPMVTVSDTVATVTWSGGVNVSEVLGRYRSPASSGSWNSAPATVTSPWVVPGLTAGTSLDVELYARTGTCDVSTSCPKVAVVGVQTLPAPTKLTGNHSAGVTTLAWDFTPYSTGYTIYRSTTNDAATATEVGTSVQASYDDPIVASGSLAYWVSATRTGSHWRVESAKSAGVPVATAEAPTLSGITAGTAVLQPTDVVTVGATVQATGGMDRGAITLCVVQASSSANAESTCATPGAGDAVTAARWTLTMVSEASLTADAANADTNSTWKARLADAPTKSEWTGNDAWDFAAAITIGKAARASSDNWYVVVMSANSVGTTTSVNGPKSMGAYFELGAVSSERWGPVTPGSAIAAPAYDPNGQPVPTPSASETRSRSVIGIWSNTNWGLFGRISGFSSAEGWSLKVASPNQPLQQGEFAMGCSAEEGGLALDSERFLGLGVKPIAGATSRGPLAIDTPAMVNLECQLFNGSAKPATYSGTVIIGIGPGTGS